MAGKRAGVDDDELVRRALDGLFEIACEDRPEAVRESLSRQIEEMPARECRTLVEQMVDTDRLADRLETETEAQPERPPSAPEAPLAKVDEALEPLVAWRCGPEAAQALHTLDDEERVHLLFDSLGPGGQRLPPIP